MSINAADHTADVLIKVPAGEHATRCWNVEKQAFEWSSITLPFDTTYHVHFWNIDSDLMGYGVTIADVPVPVDDVEPHYMRDDAYPYSIIGSAQFQVVLDLLGL